MDAKQNAEWLRLFVQAANKAADAFEAAARKTRDPAVAAPLLKRGSRLRIHAAEAEARLHGVPWTREDRTHAGRATPHHWPDRKAGDPFERGPIACARCGLVRIMLLREGLVTTRYLVGGTWVTERARPSCSHSARADADRVRLDLAAAHANPPP